MNGPALAPKHGQWRRSSIANRMVWNVVQQMDGRDNLEWESNRWGGTATYGTTEDDAVERD